MSSSSSRSSQETVGDVFQDLLSHNEAMRNGIEEAKKKLRIAEKRANEAEQRIQEAMERTVTGDPMKQITNKMEDLNVQDENALPAPSLHGDVVFEWCRELSRVLSHQNDTDLLAVKYNGLSEAGVKFALIGVAVMDLRSKGVNVMGHREFYRNQDAPKPVGTVVLFSELETTNGRIDLCVLYYGDTKCTLHMIEMKRQVITYWDLFGGDYKKGSIANNNRSAFDTKASESCESFMGMKFRKGMRKEFETVGDKVKEAKAQIDNYNVPSKLSLIETDCVVRWTINAVVDRVICVQVNEKRRKVFWNGEIAKFES